MPERLTFRATDAKEFPILWKNLQIARAQVAVQRAAEKRMEIAAQLEAYAALEKAGGKSTETHLTYPRVREQLRIAEADEKSAQWHLERLHRRIYGNSLEVTLPTSEEWLKDWDEGMNSIYTAMGRQRPSPQDQAARDHCDEKHR